MPDAHIADLWELASRLGFGTLMGIIIGFERQWRQRSAGLQTSALVAVGSTLFSTIGPSFGINDLRVVANIVTGVGFLAGGVILRDGISVSGLNTAATIWSVAAIGALSGLGLFWEALLGTLVITALNATMAPAAVWINRRVAKRTGTDDDSNA